MSLHRRFGPLAVAACLLLLALVGGGCGGSSPSLSSGPQRPTTTARLLIVSPTPNQVTGSIVNLQLNLIGARVVPPAQVKGKLRGDEGHIHVSVDGQLVSMTYGLTQQLPALPPGSHTVQAEFVASDHLPFANRVVTAVIFRTQ
jgi:hypothetical protein